MISLSSDRYFPELLPSALDGARDLLMMMCYLDVSDDDYASFSPAVVLDRCLLHPYNVWRVKVVNALNEAAILQQEFDLAMQLGLANLDGMT